jgi:hypothetical protein
MQRGASLDYEGGREGSPRNFVEELLFEVDVNVNVLFRMARARGKGSARKMFFLPFLL